jgi:lysozyme
MRTLSPHGLSFIKSFEALRLYAYPDPASDLARASRSVAHRWGLESASEILVALPEAVRGLSGDPWSIGYGSTHGVNRGMSIDARTADEMLRRDLAPVVVAVNALGLPLGQNQFDAIVSASYNLGTGVLAPHRSLGQALRGIGELDVPQALALYDHAGPHRVPGLTRRRAAEGTLWATPDGDIA